MDTEQIRTLRDRAVRLEDEARLIAEELHRLDELRGELGRRYSQAVDELRRIVGDLAEVAGSGESRQPASGCAWCGGDAAAASPPGEVCTVCVARHGFERMDHLPRMTHEEADGLPYGVIVVDPDGVVQRYNRAEEEVSGRRRDGVIGRNFFRDVAPCTAVRGFEGRFREMVARGESAREAFRYVFRFPGRERLVGISLRFDAEAGRGVIAVVPLDEARAA